MRCGQVVSKMTGEEREREREGEREREREKERTGCVSKCVYSTSATN